MTYVKFLHTDADDERWVEAGADALALHLSATVWCDRHLTDGRISAAMAFRVALAVPPERTTAAVAALVDQGFWTEDGNSYVLADFLERAFPAEQVKRTRARWNADKARRRQHAVGDHSLCKDPKFCPKASTPASTSASTVESEGGGSGLDQTRPDSTRPDRRSGSRRVEGGEGERTADAALASPQGKIRHAFTDDGNGLGYCATCGLPQGNAAHREGAA